MSSSSSIEIELMSAVFDLLGSTRVAQSPARQNHQQLAQPPTIPAPTDLPVSDESLEEWVLGPSPALQDLRSEEYDDHCDDEHQPARARPPIDPSPEAEELSVALVEAHLRAAREDMLIAETEAALRKVRAIQMDQLREAIQLLQDEQNVRKRRFNALAEELQKLDAKKESIIVGYLAAGSDGVVGSDANSGNGSIVGTRRSAPEVVYSYDFARNIPTRRGRKQAEPPQPGAIPVACGPLTKRDVENHFQRFWEAQRHRRLANDDRAMSLNSAPPAYH